MKNKIIGFVFGVLSLGIVNAASATELKLATFEPVSYTHLTLPTSR